MHFCAEGDKSNGVKMKMVAWLICVLGGAMLLLFACNPERYKDERRMKMAGMQILATAIEEYYVDHGQYPPSQPWRYFTSHAADLQKISQAGGDGIEGIDYNTLLATDRATTLVATRATPEGIEVSLADPFARVDALPFAYYHDASGWLLWSPGEDLHYDIVGSRDYSSSETQPSAAILVRTYDPSNGTESGGDIWRVKQ